MKKKPPDLKLLFESWKNGNHSERETIKFLCVFKYNKMQYKYIYIYSMCVYICIYQYMYSLYIYTHIQYIHFFVCAYCFAAAKTKLFETFKVQQKPKCQTSVVLQTVSSLCWCIYLYILFFILLKRPLRRGEPCGSDRQHQKTLWSLTVDEPLQGRLWYWEVLQYFRRSGL